MFGTNPIVGKAFFKDAPKDTLTVTSMFYTFQGEGPYTGLPSVFVRLTKCNLSCSFCDTMFEQGQVMTFDEIMKGIEKIVEQANLVGFWARKGYQYKFGLVITGGEPTLQKNLEQFLSEYSSHFLWTQIESNGIITLDLHDGVTVVVSPKCLEKDGKPVKYLKPTDEMLKRADCLKFVTSADPDSPYNTVPDWALEWKQETRRNVYVTPMNVYKTMPQKMRLILGKEDKTLEERSTSDEVVSFWEEGVLDREANRKNHEYAAQYALRNGLRFQIQTHLLASVA